MIAKLLTEHHLEFLSLKGGCRGSSESTHCNIYGVYLFNLLFFKFLLTQVLEILMVYKLL